MRGCPRERLSARSVPTTHAPASSTTLSIDRAAFICCDSLEDARLGREISSSRSPRTAELGRRARGPRVVAGRVPSRERERHRGLQVERHRAIGSRDRARGRPSRDQRDVERPSGVAATGSCVRGRFGGRDHVRSTAWMIWAGRAGVTLLGARKAVHDVLVVEVSARDQPRSCFRTTYSRHVPRRSSAQPGRDMSWFATPAS